VIPLRDCNKFPVVCFKFLINRTNYTQKIGSYGGKKKIVSRLGGLGLGWILFAGGDGRYFRLGLLDQLGLHFRYRLRFRFRFRFDGSGSFGQLTGSGLLLGRRLAEDGLLDAQNGCLKGQSGEDGGGQSDAEVVPPAEDLKRIYGISKSGREILLSPLTAS